jgi:hypothetical protein
VEQLRCDEHEGQHDGGDDLDAEVVGGVLHAGEQGDDGAGEDGEQERADGGSELGVVGAGGDRGVLHVG